MRSTIAFASVSECTSRNVNVQKYSFRFWRSIFRTVNWKADRLFIRFPSELFLSKQGKARRERGAPRHAPRSRSIPPPSTFGVALTTKLLDFRLPAPEFVH